MINEITAISTAELKEKWEHVYYQSALNPFLSWEWFSGVVAQAGRPDLIIESQCDLGRPLGLCFFFRRLEKGKRVLYLNKSGIPKFDQPWIEYNSFLTVTKLEKKVSVEVADYLFSNVSFDELVVGASTKQSLGVFELFFTTKRVEWYSQTYRADLTQFKNKSEYLASLSSNTRYQIRRSFKGYLTFGAYKVHRAETSVQAVSWFNEAAPHHISRWKNTRVGSGFENTSFTRFHKDFIQSCFTRGNIDILKIKFGNVTIAYLYNFIVGKRVYFYLSANVYTKIQRHAKPGLVAHTLAIDYYISKGFEMYDFMGGESQYKRSLATDGEPMSITRFQRSNWKTFFEKQARYIKHSIWNKSINESFQKKRVFVTGGTLNPKSDKAKYGSALVLEIELSSNKKPKIIRALSFQPDVKNKNYTSSTNVIFKSASIYNDSLYIPTETEIKKVDIKTMTIVDSYSSPSFNDLHHVFRRDNVLHIANTGLDCVCHLNMSDNSITHSETVDGSISRYNNITDFRELASTKPHLSHPNYCFELDGKLWVTRCDFMDAVCIDSPDKRIFIGDGLVHDGVVFGKYVYFTTVNGHIKLYDKQTMSLHCAINISVLDVRLDGWFRGIRPIDNGIVIIAMSKSRKSKRMSKKSRGSLLILVDIYKKKILQTWGVGSLGLDAIFSVIEVPKND